MSAVTSARKKPAGRGAKSAARKVVLEKVIGNTIVHNSAFSCNPATGELAYPAGCVVVIYSPKKNRQIKFLSNRENKAISFLKFSPNGKYLAVGESGHKPAVYVWDTSNWTIVAELRGHKFGVSCGCFSPNNKYLVTVGFQHDGSVFVWDWRNGTAAASNKVATKIYAVAFSEDGTYFVTAGFRHVKFWHVDTIGVAKPNEKGGKVPGQTSVIEGRAGTLGANRDSVFLDVACGTGPAAAFTFCVTSKGLICQFGPNRSMDRWVNLKADRVFGLALSQDIVACGCSDGIVRLFQATDLTYLTTIPKPHAIGKEDNGPSDTPGDVYPDALAIQLSSDSQRLSVVYTDRSLLLWDLRNRKKAGFLRAFLSHCACIWDVAIPSAGPLPEGSFITCGADNTIRVWNLDLQNLTSVAASVNVDASIASLQKLYNKDTVRTLHAVTDHSIFKAKDNVDVRTSSEMLPSVSNDTGIRCLAVTPDGKQLAAGDRQGNLRIYNLPSYECVAEKEVHDAEILTLDYSSPQDDDKSKSAHTLLATASRDRLVHVFDATKNYDLVSTLDDHSSSITAVKFAVGGTRLLTCSADKSIVFRNVEQTPNHPPTIRRYHQTVVQYGTLYDMDVDPTQKYLVSAGQDKKLSIYTLNQPKVIRSYKTDIEAGEVLKVSLDPAGIYAVTSCADKVMRIYDFYSGECLAKMPGHSELVTGVKFTRDCRRLISVAGDGCIFVWKLSAEFTKSMKDRMAERNPSLNPSPNPSPSHPPSTSPQLPLGAATPIIGHSASVPNVSPITAGKHYTNDPELSNYDFQPVPHGEVFGKDHSDLSMNDSVLPKFKFSETALPSWAKNDKSAAPKEERPVSAAADKVKGRWAQRVEGNEGFALYSDLSEEDKPVVKWAEKGRRYTIEPDSIHADKSDKWASPSRNDQPRDAKNAKDLLVSDMDSSLRHVNAKAVEDDDAVLVDNVEFADADPRMRASQVGMLEDDDEESEGAVGEGEDEEEKDEKEGKGEEEKEKEEPIYFQGEDNSKGFEVDTPQVKPPQATDKTPPKQEEEDEEIDELKDLSEIKDDDEESFRKMYEKYDFIKSNFDNLSVTPLAQNPMRLSISRKFLEQPGQPKEEKASAANTSTEEPNKPKKAKEPLSKEVEKTRERLLKMGIVLPSATLKNSGDGIQTTSPPQPSPTSAPITSSSSSSAPSLSSVSPPQARLASSASASKLAQNPAQPSPPPLRAPSPPSVPPPTLSPTQTLSSTTVRTSPNSTAQFAPAARTSPNSTAQFAATQDLLRGAGTTLRRPLADYESALGALSASLNQSLQMWKEVRESAQSDATANHLNQQFQSLFASFSGQIAKVDPTVTASFTPSQTALETAISADALEHYSDLLVAKVVQKLDSVDLQTRLLQSLSASMKNT